MAIKINGTNTAAAPGITGPDTDTGLVYGTNQIDFSTGGTSRATIDSNGRLGVGTTSAGGKLAILSNSSTYEGLELQTPSGDGSGEFHIGVHQSGSTAGRSIVFKRGGADGMDTESMRISSNGAVSVGSTANNFGGSILATSGYYICAYNGDNLLTNASQGGGSATLYIGNAAIQVSSDQRIKTDIVDTTLDATTKLKQVRVVDFKWNDPTDKAKVNRNSRGTWTGCLAQEMVNVFPYTVNAPREDDNSIDTESERIWGLEYQHLVPALIKGFQEQQAKIETLETKVAALEAG